MKDIFWEKSYENNSIKTFGNPSKEVELLANKISKNSFVLDMGCGDGRHSLYLAEKGFYVDAFDISKNGINKLNILASKNNLKINAWTEEIETFIFKKQYDVIIAHGLFQFIKKDVREKVIKEMKNQTKKGGYNVIAVFTDIIELPQDMKPYLIGIFKEGEIKEYYKDWVIEDFQTYVFEDEHENNIKHKHAINKLIVRKPL